MGALSYFLEREGIMTTGISLVRENTESMQPPRALWVSFPLGLPLGKPADAAFQRNVITTALDLLNSPQGPVLADYPLDIPQLPHDTIAACPVSFPEKIEPGNSWSSRLRAEYELLNPWYELSLRRRNGRTLVALAPQSPAENIKTLGHLLDNADFPSGISWLKPAIEDLKAFYHEAMTAQPGNYDANSLQTRFWQETTLGAAILALYHHYLGTRDDRMKLIATILVPRNAVDAATGPAGDTDNDQRTSD